MLPWRWSSDGGFSGTPVVARSDAAVGDRRVADAHNDRTRPLERKLTAARILADIEAEGGGNHVMGRVVVVSSRWSSTRRQGGGHCQECTEPATR
jgi:hypothetical protein